VRLIDLEALSVAKLAGLISTKDDTVGCGTFAAACGQLSTLLTAASQR
jgi:hypothetical protein